jgi:hypothetical protein
MKPAFISSHVSPGQGLAYFDEGLVGAVPSVTET